ncbi:MAG: glutamate ABC transporter substrate-binding protein [Chloroflexi bacterium]|nr:glutamate ABC transporter substrate-binding protein [Chloroflexota bacterium]
MRRILGKVIALGAAMAVLAAACGGGAQPQASASAAATATAATKPKFELATYMYSIQTKGKIRVGTREDNVPFGLKNPTTGKYEGFDIDIVREFTKAIFGKDADADPDKFIEFVPVVSATRIPTLNDNKADIVAATFTINDERLKQIDFSTVYFRTGQKILVKKTTTNINAVADLNGKTVCTAKGSTSEQNITKQAKDAKLLLLDTYPPCLLALQQGQADAVSTDETILFGLVKQDPTTKIVGGYFSDEPYGIGVNKGREGFVPFLNSVIAAMVADGRWAAIYKKYITPVSGDVKDGPHDKGRPAS